MRLRFPTSRVMKLFRRKDKKKNVLLDVPGGFGGYDQLGTSSPTGFRGGWTSPPFSPTARSGQMLDALPPAILQRIFAFTCPHSQDESYDTCEQSAAEDACMLCDLRDLAHCAQVNKKWRANAVLLLYHSIRIDAVHYCEREVLLSEKRKRRSFFDRNGEPEDTAEARLKLLCRTVREDPTRRGALVQFLKTPYMLRESSQADLARTLAVLPNLRYVDLPEGLFQDEAPFKTLRLEVQARCPDIRKMTYMAGSERSFDLLARGGTWKNLEVLELIRINVDPAVMRQVLAALGNLRALKVTDTKSFTDEIFVQNEMLPPFPALTEFVLSKTPRVTSAGLVEYLNRASTRKALSVLTLNNTGVKPSDLQDVLAVAPFLKTLAITEQVSSPFPSGANVNTQLLSSASLRTVRYEISPESSSSPYSGITTGYYNYLAASLLGGGLPNVRAVYVRDTNFADQLLGLPPPMAPFAAFGTRPTSSSSSNTSGYLSPVSPARSAGLSPLHSPLRPVTSGNQATQRFSSNNPFANGGSLNRTLEVFTKGDEGMDWSFVKVSPVGSRHGRSRALSGSGLPQRPVSSYGLGADVAGTGWGNGGARRSVMVGNGAGGFLPLPADRDESRDKDDGEWPRPLSSSGYGKGDRDLWR